MIGSHHSVGKTSFRHGVTVSVSLSRCGRDGRRLVSFVFGFPLSPTTSLDSLFKFSDGFRAKLLRQHSVHSLA